MCSNLLPVCTVANVLQGLAAAQNHVPVGGRLEFAARQLPRSPGGRKVIRGMGKAGRRCMGQGEVGRRMGEGRDETW